MVHQVILQKLPKTLEEMLHMEEAKLWKPEYTAALTVAALCLYPENKEESLKMLNFLKGPRPLSVYEQQFIRDRLMDGKDYIPRSYIKGAVPENNYQITAPYVIEVSESVYQPTEQGYLRFDMKSGGADSTRPLTVRNKPSSGQWFLWEQSLLAGIRIPVSQDEWA